MKRGVIGNNYCTTIALLTGLASVAASPCFAHEFWIEPLSGSAASKPVIVSDLRNGEDFGGVAYPFLSAVHERFELVDKAGIRTISASENSLPAINIPSRTNGEHTLIYVSDTKYLEYEKLSDVLNFAMEDGLTDTLNKLMQAEPDLRGWSETYTRNAKSLFYRGDSILEDKAHGLELEIILEQPLDLRDQAEEPRYVSFRVEYLGRPLASSQVSIFEKKDVALLGTLDLNATGSVIESRNTSDSKLTKKLTDQDGKFTVPVVPGVSYLLGVVHAKPTDNKQYLDEEDKSYKKVNWQTVWSSLTFSSATPF